MKDELHSQEELSVAAVAYITPVWLGLLLFKRWRSNYYTRYHLVHAAILSMTLVALLAMIALLTQFSTLFVGYNFFFTLVTGLAIGMLLLAGAGFTLYCGLSAYRGRYTVIPLLTKFYYLVFSQKMILKDNPYDSRRITHLKPYLKSQDPSES